MSFLEVSKFKHLVSIYYLAQPKLADCTGIFLNVSRQKVCRCRLLPSWDFTFGQGTRSRASHGTSLILCSIVWKSKLSTALHNPEYTEHYNTHSSLDHAGRSNSDSKGKRKKSHTAPVFKLQTQMWLRGYLHYPKAYCNVWNRGVQAKSLITSGHGSQEWWEQQLQVQITELLMPIFSLRIDTEQRQSCGTNCASACGTWWKGNGRHYSHTPLLEQKATHDKPWQHFQREFRAACKSPPAWTKQQVFQKWSQEADL